MSRRVALGGLTDLHPRALKPGAGEGQGDSGQRRVARSDHAALHAAGFAHTTRMGNVEAGAGLRIA